MILVFGATGTLGQALVRVAKDQGQAIRGVARQGADHAGDITDGRRVAALINEVRPTSVINAAALTDISYCEQNYPAAEQVNAGGVANLVEACRPKGIRFIQVSTDHFYTGDKAKLHKETDEVSLVNNYARSKYAGERFALTLDDALVVRTNLTGWRGWKDPTFIEWAVSSLETGQSITLFDDFFTSTIDAVSLADIILRFVDKRDVKGILNIAAAGAVSKRDFVMRLARDLRITPQEQSGSVKSLAVPRAESAGLDVSLCETILGEPLPKMEKVVSNLLAQRPRSG